MNKSEVQFLVEGFADFVLLVECGIPAKKVDIQSGNSGIAKAMKNQIRNYHKVIIGITDFDKKNLPDYFNEFVEISCPDNFIVKKRENSNQYLIFLKPAIEKWLLEAAKENQSCLIENDIPTELKKLKKITKRESILKDMRFRRFIKCLKSNNAEPIKFLFDELARLKKA